MTLPTGFIHDTRTLEHDTGRGHPERPDRILAILDAFEWESIKPHRLEASPATNADLLRVHTENHLRAVLRACNEIEAYPDPDTPMGEGSWDAAMLAAGAAIVACQAVLDKRCKNVFSAMRPPGHHAEPDRAMGFCLFNNIAIAARWLQHEAGVKKVAILDWDVHHGNGTQTAFYDDDTVYYASIHQSPLYPGTGHAEERGKNRSNLNVLMPPGRGPDAWLHALEEQVLPEITAFEPDFLLLSAGFDAHERDPLAQQRLDAATFAEMTRRVRKIAGGRIVSLLEGGYNLQALGESSVAHFQALVAEE
jgi:acetoin utilization deacetylase AcuC-like enzyme